MEPDQQSTAERDNETTQQTESEQIKCEEKCDKIEKTEETKNIESSQSTDSKPEEQNSIRNDSQKDDSNVVVPQSIQLNSTDIKSELEIKLNETNSENNETSNSKTDVDKTNEKCGEQSDEKKSVEIETKNNNDSKSNSNYMSAFPGIKTGNPSGNDGKIEIDRESLFDRVILYSLKNTVVDNSRLDAAKNKYIKNNGNVNASFNTSNINNNSNNSSNGSDSNSTSKSVEKLIEEFKGSCKSNNGNTPSTTTSTTSSEQPKIDNKEISNGADNKIDSLEPANRNVENEKLIEDIKVSPKPPDDVDNSSPVHDAIDLKTNSPNMEVSQQKINTENEGLDFRDSSNSNTKINEDKAGPTMLDLSVKRDDKSVPPIKRSHALYVGIPDFSKQIFTAPSITRTVTDQGKIPLPSSSSNNSGVAPKVRNPDFSNMTRAPELQMRHPDFSKSFSNQEKPQSTNVQITPSNFTEIARKNNYISDLQLKPPSNASMTPSTSYKIDYRPSSMAQQKVLNEQQQNIENNTHNKSLYPNSKRDSGNIYNQQLIDEPMAHIIHKNQFLPATKEPINSNWNENRERLLGGSSYYETIQYEKKMPGTSQPFPSNDDLRKLHPAHYSYAYKDREIQHQSNEFSLKQKEQLLRQEGTTITIKNEANAKTPTQEFPERRSADLFRDYKLKQPKESPDTARRVNETSPIAYHQQYPDFPPNYLRSVKPENINIKINPTSPAPQPSHSTQEYPPLMPHYKNPSPIPHRHQKSPSMHSSSPMNPPQNWPPIPSQSSRHSMSPANMSPSPSHMYPHAGPSKSSISPSQSPISNYPYHSSPKLNTQMFKHPEATSSRPIDSKRSPMPNHSPGQNYYHHRYPDFTRKFEAERNNAMYMQEQGPKIPSNYSTIDTKPLTIDLPQPNIPLRQDLEIRTIREPSDNRLSQYPHPSSASYVLPQERDISRLPPTQQQPMSDNISIRPPYSRLESEASIILPDLKIEKRINEPTRIYSPITARRQESVPELSIIPKIKTEPPSSTPIPINSSIIKSSKSIFAEVKRESPLDLSVKTIKTKADSTGCDTDFRYKKESKLGLKIEFTPNFGNVSKTDCRQQARLGPQDYNVERSTHEIPVRYVKDQEVERNSTANKSLEPQIATNTRNHFYGQKQQQPTSDADRPHAPVPSIPNYYPDQHKPNNIYEGNNSKAPNSTYPNPEYVRRSHDNLRHENNFAQKSFQPIPQRSNYHSSQQILQNHIPYPVINKPSPTMPGRMQSQPTNSKDSLEREKDRRYVENILYGRSRKDLEQKPFPNDSRQFQPIASPPRKRHNEMSNQHMYDPIAPKQSRIEEPPRLYNSNIPPHAYERHEQNMNTVPSTHTRHETYPKLVNTSNELAYKHYPIPRKDVIKSTEMMTYNNQSPASSYYPNPKAEMIHRNDPSMSQKYYSRETDRNFYHNQQPPPKQNFLPRPDDASYPTHIPRISHPVQDMSIKVEQLTPGPIPENQGEPQKHLNNMLMPSSVSGSNGNIARGAEQSTIQKLKSNLELKEMQKLKKNEMCEEVEHIKLLNMQSHHTKIDLSPRQFRTKGELKGYTPLPLNNEANKVNADIQQGATSGFDLLDWGSACNDFVQQLQTGNRKRLKKKRPFSATKNFIKNDEKMMAKLPGTTSNNLSEVPKEILQSINDNNEKYSSSDEDKPLVEIINSITHDNMSEKLSRNFREQQRQVVEQKFAARLGRPSSSESETDTRKAVISVKRVRRLRKREHLGIKKTDDERSAEEGEIDDDAQNKSKNLKVRSKLDDLTSSDEDKKKTSKDDKKSCESKTVDSNLKSTRKSTSELKESQSKKNIAESSDESSESTSEEETTEDKIKKLATERNAKKLKDLGDGSNFKVLLQEEETMTRSKRKLEIEKKLSNSKILRNDKIVQNITPDKKGKIETCTNSNKKSPLKRKDSNKSEDSKRKMPESENEKESPNSTKKKQRKISRAGDKSSSEGSEEEEEEEENKTERLRPRKIKTETETTSKAAAKETAKKKVAKEEIESTLKASDYKEGRRSLSALYPFREDKTSKFTPGWEAEAYNFKRSLNVPPGLITIGRPPQHGISHSLPDLDPQTSDTSEIFSEFIKSKDRDAGKDVRGEQSRKGKKLPPPSKPEIKKPPNSIIDLLHQRVIQSSNKKIKQNSKKATTVNKDKEKNNKIKEKEGAKASKDTNESQPTSSSEKEGDKSTVKRNIFEPFIITSRTRTENNAIRKKEILKEVFGTDEDRPRSAPPSAVEKNAEEESEKRLSFDQKYREYLEKMNVDFPERKTYLDKLTQIKQEIKEEEDDFDDNETVVASERDLVTPTIKGKAKKNRPRRLKGSSGFDYIRKKKKPTPHSSENPSNVNAMIKKRLAAMENQETKDENDISKEIKGWVLNKGVGESVLHKASRLNYVDVVAYCLDRMGMNPDSKDNAGYTPLHEACSRGHLEIARLLLQYGANHSEAALSGIRPLHEAIENGNIEMVRLLLSFGADPCLATYSGQLPITMAEDKEMEDFLSAYLIDTNHKEGRKTSWSMDGAFKIEDPDEIGYDIFSNVPIVKTDLGSSVASILSTSMTSLVTATTQLSDNETVISETATTIPSKILSTPMKAPTQDLIKYQHKMKKCDTNSNNLVISDANNTESSKSIIAASKKTKNCSVLLNNIDSTMKKIKKLPSISKLDSHTIKSNETIHKIEEISNHKEDYDDMIIDENLESDCEFFEVEESEAPLPPLYLLRDEGSEKWILLTDLCNLLKVKSKEAVLKQICPSSPPSANKELIRELKMSEFLEKAMCLQLFCAGEKINIRASKVSLVRYTENVKNLLGVHTIKMNL